ncbi:hypothetical protein EV426DRAFT_570284 [Tirmania nivea]|nr:hypothetical protein EV426DRAFT_570284 [Tirmania nivea]
MHNNARMCSRVPVEERVITVPTIEWRDVLETHTMCGCNGQAQCAGDKRLVDISNVPVESELVALVKLPREQRSGSEVMGVCALYMLGDLCPHYFAHWVKKVDRNQSVRYGF